MRCPRSFNEKTGGAPFCASANGTDYLCASDRQTSSSRHELFPVSEMVRRSGLPQAHRLELCRCAPDPPRSARSTLACQSRRTVLGFQVFQTPPMTTPSSDLPTAELVEAVLSRRARLKAELGEYEDACCPTARRGPMLGLPSRTPAGANTSNRGRPRHGGGLICAQPQALPPAPFSFA